MWTQILDKFISRGGEYILVSGNVCEIYLKQEREGWSSTFDMIVLSNEISVEF